MTPLPPLRLVIADDHALFRQGLKTMLRRRADVTVVADVEPALADLPERDQGETLVGEAGEGLVHGDRAEEHLHRVLVVAGGAAAQQGEGAVVVQELGQVHGSSSVGVRRCPSMSVKVGRRR